MSVYMVERELPGITMDQLADAQAAAIKTAEQMTADGTPVRYLRSAFVPEDQRCFCFFEAADAEVVKSLNEQAQIPNRDLRRSSRPVQARGCGARPLTLTLTSPRQ